MSRGEVTYFNPDGSVARVEQKAKDPTPYFDEKRIALNRERLPNESKELYDFRLALRAKILKNMNRGKRFIKAPGKQALGNRETRRRARHRRKKVSNE